MLLRACAAGSRAPPTNKAIDDKTGGERRAHYLDRAQAAKPTDRRAESRAEAGPKQHTMTSGATSKAVTKPATRLSLMAKP